MSNEKETLADYIFHGMDDTGLTSNEKELMKWIYGVDDSLDGFANQTVKFKKTDIEGSARKSNIRKLNQSEIDILLPIFGTELEYSAVRIRFNSIYTIGNFSRGVGNYICIKDGDVDSEGVIKRKVLIHEAAHVWQYQGHMKWRYAGEAILGHAQRYLTFGDFDPYEYKTLEGKVPWHKWNVEAQAQWIQENEMLPTDSVLNPSPKEADWFGFL